MVASVQNGTQAATIGTEHALGGDIAAPGTYILVVNTANMVNGDVVELRAKTKVLPGGAAGAYLLATYAHVQGDPVKMSIPVPSPYSLACTLKQTAGAAGRSFEWNILGL